MISLAAHQLGCEIVIIITASHNPPSYNGFKLKAKFGGPLEPEKINEVEALIPDVSSINFQSIELEQAVQTGQLEEIDMETRYVDHVKANFDLNAIDQSGLQLMYDAMYGAGQRVLPRILPKVALLHCDPNPSFMGTAPEPIAKNLQELAQTIKKKGNIACALATDGDADRIGLYNGHGEFVDSHHIILLLIHYMVKYKQMNGKVVLAFYVTPRVEKLCKHYGLELEITKIGFKEIAAIMIKEDVLLGG